jgi:hypothetical protein
MLLVPVTILPVLPSVPHIAALVLALVVGVIVSRVLLADFQ